MAARELAVASRREWHAIARPAIDAFRRRGLRAFPLTLILVSAIAIGGVINTSAVGHHLIRSYADEYAALPFFPAVFRMLPSALAPAYRLPIWGALVQVLIVVAVAESLYGARVTATVAVTCHTVATVSARVFVWIGPRESIGMVARVAHIADSGPSGATVGLIAFVAIVERAQICRFLLALFLATEWIIPSGLAEREHLVAALVGLAIALVCVRRGWSLRRDAAPAALRCPDLRGVGL